MPLRSAAVLLLLGTALAVPAVDANPRYDYLLHCGGCHLEDGSGDPPEVPDLRADIDRIIHLPGGRDYLARVPGSFQAPISDARLAVLLNWIVVTFNPEVRDFEPFTGEEIGRYRARPLLDPLRYRAEIWSRLDELPYADASDPAEPGR